MKLAQLSIDDKPRERLLRYGAASLSVVELLAVLLRTGTRGEDVLALASSLLDEHGGLSGLCRADPAELMQRKGLKKAKAAMLTAALELGHRIAIAETGELPAWEMRLTAIARNARFIDREQIHALFLDAGGGVLSEEIISYGGLDGAFLDIPVFFRKAVRLSAHSVVIIHNHPDGEISPSREDLALTEHIRRGLKVLGLKLRAHFIAANGEFFKIPLGAV